MAITEADIKLLQSARMTDNPDGGGRMTGNVVQSGVDNNIFDDVSNLDRVYGNVSLRKVFPAVLTNTTDKYMGARVIIDEPPEDENVHGLLFGASSLFDVRDGAKQRVEAYLAVGAAYPGILFGNHLAGMRSILLLQKEDRVIPSIGAVLVLIQNQGALNEKTQYVRITSVEHALYSFTDQEGDYTRRMVTCGISDMLRETLGGWGATRYELTPDTLDKTYLYTTVVADAAQYFGIKPLAAAAAPGAFAIKAASTYSALLPSAQSETPITDSRTNNRKAVLMPSGLVYGETVTMAWSPTQNLYVGGGIVPGSFRITDGTTEVFEENGKLWVGATEVGTLDSAEGIARLASDVYGGTTNLTYQFAPASAESIPEKSLAIPVGISNRSLTYACTLIPRPVRGSLSVSYMAEGNWYSLQDQGSGAMFGSQAGHGAGNLNLETGTVTVTLGALPDVGSAIVFSWVDSHITTAVSPAEMLMRGYAYFAINSDGDATEEKGSKAFTPLNTTVTWTVGATTYTATDNGLGSLAGDGTGTVDYADGVVRLIPNILPPLGTMINVSSKRADKSTASSVNINGGAVVPNLVPRSVSFALSIDVLHTAPDAQSVTGTPVTKSVTVLDAPTSGSAGDLFFTDGVNGNRNVGTINYTTGVITVAPGAPITAGTFAMEEVSVTYLGVTGTSTGSNSSTTSSANPSAGSTSGSGSYAPTVATYGGLGLAVYSR
jgi:hypothetical protein